MSDRKKIKKILKKRGIGFKAIDVDVDCISLKSGDEKVHGEVASEVMLHFTSKGKMLRVCLWN